MKRAAIIFALLGFAILVFSQNASKLSLKEIMKGHHFVGHLPQNIYWGENSRIIYFNWNPEDQLVDDLYQTDITGSAPQKVTLEAQTQLPDRRGVYSRDRKWKSYIKNGDLFLLDIEKENILQITNTIARESNPLFSRDQKRLFFTLNNNVFAWSLSDGSMQQLTDFRKGKAIADKKQLPDQQQWLKEDQLAHFEILQLKEKQRKAREEKREALQPKRPAPVYLNGRNISRVQVSPDGRYVTYLLSNSPKNSKRTKVPDFVTEEGYLND